MDGLGQDGLYRRVRKEYEDINNCGNGRMARQKQTSLIGGDLQTIHEIPVLAASCLNSAVVTAAMDRAASQRSAYGAARTRVEGSTDRRFEEPELMHRLAHR